MSLRRRIRSCFGWIPFRICVSHLGAQRCIAYLPIVVHLQGVATSYFSADFDHDGDATDLSPIWRGAFNLNQLGDADGDSDGNDFLLWQRQLGSHPTLAVGAGVPEPASAEMCLGSVAWAATAGIRRRANSFR
jgi:hypothetical protein